MTQAGLDEHAYRAGRELEPIWRNLGHKDATLLLRVYGKYRRTPKAAKERHG